MSKMYFIAFVKRAVEILDSKKYVVAVNKDNIHKYPSENSSERQIESLVNLPIDSYIYIYDSELNETTRVVTVKHFTKIGLIEPDVPMETSEELRNLIFDSSVPPNNVPPKYPL